MLFENDKNVTRNHYCFGTAQEIIKPVLSTYQNTFFKNQYLYDKIS